VGQLMFAFAPHGDVCEVDTTEVISVPDGIAPEDAVFLPSVETALSLVMDAAPQPGDRVLVIGLGVIGLLTCAVLRKCHPFATVVAVDPNKFRREHARTFAEVSEVFDPRTMSIAEIRVNKGGYNGVDIAIEVSGTGEGLNTAVSCTGRYGRVVIGSWYGTKSVTLGDLGGGFHRSHMSLIASQVTEIPTTLVGRWSKSRRFEVAWSLIRELAPSRLISRRFPLVRYPQYFKTRVSLYSLCVLGGRTRTLQTTRLSVA